MAKSTNKERPKAKKSRAEKTATNDAVISYCCNSWDKTTTDINESTMFSDIRTGKYRQPVEKIRKTYSDTLEKTKSHSKAHSAIEELKTKLPGVIWDGRYTSRDRDSGVLIEASGRYCADLDALPEQQLAEARAGFKKDKYVRGGFSSPSGAGLKPIFCVPKDADPEDIKRAVEKHVLKVTGITICAKGHGRKRLCYMSWDPECWENEDAVELPVPKSRPKKPASAPSTAAVPTANVAGASAWEQLRSAIIARGTLGTELEPAERNGKKVWKCKCPSGENHKDVVIWLNYDGPVLDCFHDGGSCTEKVKEEQKWLWSTWREILAIRALSRWVWVSAIECFVNLDTWQEHNVAQFNKWHAGLSGIKNPAAWWAANLACGKFEAAHFLPNRPLEVKKETGLWYLNRWRPCELTPLEGDVDFWTEHFEFLLSNAGERHSLNQWIRWTVEYPGEKLLWMPVIYGCQEGGKSIIGYVLEQLLGSHNIVRPTNEMLRSIYTDWAKAACLAILEELMTIGRQEQMNKLKAIITEPTIMIHEKFKGTYVQSNTFNLIAFSNYHNAVKLDKDDRRYAILSATQKPHPDGVNYYGPLWEKVKMHRNQQALLHHYLNYPMAGFNRYARAPMTKAKQEVIELSMPPIEAYLTERIRTQEWPLKCDIVNITDLKPNLPREFREWSDYKIAYALRTVGAYDLGQVKLADGRQPRLWAIRNQQIWAKNKPDAAREYFGHQQTGDNPDVNPVSESEPW
jgi:hypothetical protein